MKSQLTLSAAMLAVGAIIVAFLVGSPTQQVIQLPTQELQGVSNFLDTSSSFVSSTLMTINTTSTQVFSSINKIGYIQNNTTSTITCSQDATGTTAASSTVLANRGIMIYATSTGQLSAAAFGECYPGVNRCFPHKGAVNCLSSAQITIPAWNK